MLYEGYQVNYLTIWQKVLITHSSNVSSYSMLNLITYNLTCDSLAKDVPRYKRQQ